jgi:DNA-binding Lrp family transcriptional regulator
LKDTELKLLSELIKNSRRSDRELAKAIGVSQPTVSRTMKKLEKEELLEYTAIPNLFKLGYEIMAITFGKRKPEAPPENAEKAKDFIKKHPNIIFVSAGMGSNSDRMAISIHRDFSDYNKFMNDVRTEWEGYMNTEAFLINLKGKDILRPLSFKHVADYLKEK